ncbi:hypothetical protein FPV67DRAFT_1655896 [Lyophyllum atratum]|nr:hypothetical protein FPV67DRAFT_1656393 [Lyophyllum atratum]KAF8059879.1 hypothetical protein FPV67DRAFT_1655896 [Lyophyllum atratum]
MHLYDPTTQPTTKPQSVASKKLQRRTSTILSAMSDAIDLSIDNTPSNGVLRLIQTVEGVGGRANIHITDGGNGWDDDIRCKRLQLNIHDIHLPTVLVTLLRMDNWMSVDIHTDFAWTTILAQIVVDGGGQEVEEATIGPEGEITGYVPRDRRKLRFCIGNVSVRFYIPPPGRARPRSNVDILLETEGDTDDRYFAET